MLKVLIEKELKAVLLSPKFPATFLVCSVLILLSQFICIQEYFHSVKQYDAVSRLTEQEMQEQSSWMQLTTRAYRRPDMMQILAGGVHYDVGRFSSIGSFSNIKLTHSVYSDDPVFAVFRFVDFAFIVQVVLSMIAILFTYDAVNGERESGTLKLVFSNAVPRGHYVLSKFAGSWLGLTVPLLIPVLVSYLMLLLFKVPVTGDEWLKILAVTGIALLYFTFFIAFGVLASTLTKRSSVSFLLALVGWVLMVLIIPRAGTMLAGQMVQVPSAAELDSRIDGFSKNKWTRHMDEMRERLLEHESEMAGMTPEEREAYRNDHMWEWLEKEDGYRKAMAQEIDAYSLKVTEELRNRKAVQENLAFSLSRISPAAAFQLAVMNLAATDNHLKMRYEDAMHEYRKAFLAYLESKEDTGQHRGIMINMSTEGGLKIKTSSDAAKLDLSQLPAFEPPSAELAGLLQSALTDVGLLAGYVLAALALALVAMLRYDVR